MAGSRHRSIASAWTISRTRIALGSALAIASLFLADVACRDSSAREPTVEPIQRVRLAPSVVDRRPRAPILTSTATAEDGLESLELENASGSIVAARDGASAKLWRLTLGADSLLRLHEKFAPAKCQRVVVHASSEHDAYLQLVFERDGRPIAGSARRARIAGSGDAHTVDAAVLDVPAMMRSTSIDELELEIEGDPSTELELRSIEFYRVPLHAWFPSASEPAQLVAAGDDSRRAVGLSNAAPLAARFAVPSDGRLLCAATIPNDLLVPFQRPRVVVTLECDGKKREAELELEDTPSVERWHELSLSLAEFGGRTIDATFELRTVNPAVESFCALTQPIVAEPCATAPSVLFVTSDTHRADHVRCFDGSVDVATPNLDRLAARGVCFVDCLSATNVTNPSHVALMTGTSPRDTGIVDNFTRLSDRAVTLAERFRDAGWATIAVVSASHLGDSISGLGQGFDSMDAPSSGERSADATLDRLEAALARLPRVPTFVWLHVFDAHAPYTPPQEFERIYWPKDGASRESFASARELPPSAHERVADSDLDRVRARYRGEVSFLDSELARAFEHPRLCDGVIAFTADHGESLGEHDVYWDHAALYPQTTHVPLILAWPGAPSGRRVQRGVMSLDLARTLLDLAGLGACEFAGRDLVRSLDVAAKPEPRFALSAFGFAGSVSLDGWLLVMALEPSDIWIGGDCDEPSTVHSIELYDLRRDPTCVDDLARTEVERAAKMRRLLVDWLAGVRPTHWATAANLDGDQARQLASLGYLAGSSVKRSTWIDPHCSCPNCRAFAQSRALGALGPR